MVDGAGHQDALVGDKRGEALKKIEEFLDDKREDSVRKPKTELVAYAPWSGPVITEVLPTFAEDLPEDRAAVPALVMRLAAAPTHRAVQGLAMIRVDRVGDRLVRPDDRDATWNEEFVKSRMAFLKSNDFTSQRWGAFPVPLPERMPGHTEATRGDALLVLAVYSESPFLAQDGREYAYFRASADGTRAEEFLPLIDVGETNLEAVELHIDTFTQVARAVVEALVAQAQPALTGVPARDRPGHPVLIAAEDWNRLELPQPPVSKVPPLPSTARLVFGTNTAAGAAVVGAADLDAGCGDGVIPYDSPQEPLTQPAATGTIFALMSCQYPAGFLDEPVAYASYRHLAERIDRRDGSQPRFLVLTGDQVYVDPTAGLYDPSARDARYSRPYETWLRQRDVRNVLRRIPSFMLLDDHEIDDNWEPLSQPRNRQQTDPQSLAELKLNGELVQEGVDAYRTYQRASVIGDATPGSGSSNQSFKFRFDGFPFFMLDTRSNRAPRTIALLQDATLFDDETSNALKAWLTKEEHRDIPKFVVTPAILLPRHRRAAQDETSGKNGVNLSALHSDGWDGYPKTLFEILGFIAHHKIKHVVFLSGDEHRGCIASAELFDAKTGASLTRVHSVHTTAAYAPFPFANSLPSDFAEKDTIELKYGDAHFRCVVEAELPDSHDGALLLHPSPTEDGAWQLCCEFANGFERRLVL